MAKKKPEPKKADGKMQVLAGWVRDLETRVTKLERRVKKLRKHR